MKPYPRPALTHLAPALTHPAPALTRPLPWPALTRPAPALARPDPAPPPSPRSGYASIRFADRSRWKLRASSRETCIWETPSSALIWDWVRLL